MKYFILFFLTAFSSGANAQQIESIAFHLYTDSLKKVTYNYINVDGKLSNNHYLPLTGKQLKLESNTGTWDGNSLIIDSLYKGDSVVIKATLKEKPALSATITIYIKKSTYEGKLYKEEELFQSDKIKKQKKK